MGHTNYWTDQQRALLRKLAEQGLPRDVIAARLGRSKERVSRELTKLRRDKRLPLTTNPERR